MRFVFGDVETSGLGPDAGVVEVAYTETDEQMQVLGSGYSLIDPCVPIQPGAAGVHNITDDMVRDAPTLEEYFSVINPGLFQDEDTVLVAHNAAFDVRFLGPHIPRLVGTMCTLKLARILFPDCENHKLSTLKYALGLDKGESHSADGDVTTLLSLVRTMMETSGMTLEDLYQLARTPILVEVMPFGKHKGTRLRDLPKGYVKWLLDLDSLDDNLRYSLELL